MGPQTETPKSHFFRFWHFFCRKFFEQASDSLISLKIFFQKFCEKAYPPRAGVRLKTKIFQKKFFVFFLHIFFTKKCAAAGEGLSQTPDFRANFLTKNLKFLKKTPEVRLSVRGKKLSEKSEKSAKIAFFALSASDGLATCPKKGFFGPKIDTFGKKEAADGTIRGSCLRPYAFWPFSRFLKNRSSFGPVLETKRVENTKKSILGIFGVWAFLGDFSLTPAAGGQKNTFLCTSLSLARRNYFFDVFRRAYGLSTFSLFLTLSEACWNETCSTFPCLRPAGVWFGRNFFCLRPARTLIFLPLKTHFLT